MNFIPVGKKGEDRVQFKIYSLFRKKKLV